MKEKIGSSKRSDKVDNPLARWTMKKREKTQITKIRKGS